MDGSPNRDAALRIARNEAIFRDVNERIEATNERFAVALERTDFVCECADDTCMGQLQLTLEEYEALRLVPTHFVVRIAHVYPQFERVVEKRDAYAIVEKFGEAGKQAMKLDPRRASGDLPL